ncbi:MAG: di-trans,poly-cis-decaprenylcistransferase [Helicobacteraceae bacterium]|nr:di-trans,poly-cis-decaprenylcistransferase [Helicobacteraceae bacterium]
MDGNGRWAKERKMKRTEGHKEGVKVVREITKWCATNGIKFLSLYAFSTENWTRPKIEVDFLMKLLEQHLKNESKTYDEYDIRFKVIGDTMGFSKKLRNLITSLENSSAKNSTLTQILALNYGSRDEIARAILKMNKNGIPNGISKNDMINLLENSLDTKEIPDVDLLIRTGGEMRLSNFLLYQCAYAELSFSKTLFPDFNIEELKKIIENFKQRNRRFGAI